MALLPRLRATLLALALCAPAALPVLAWAVLPALYGTLPGSYAGYQGGTCVGSVCLTWPNAGEDHPFFELSYGEYAPPVPASPATSYTQHSGTPYSVSYTGGYPTGGVP